MRKLFAKFFTSLVIFLCSFQLAFAETAIQYKSTTDVSSEALDLKMYLENHISELKEKIYGIEDRSHCQKEGAEDLLFREMLSQMMAKADSEDIEDEQAAEESIEEEVDYASMILSGFEEDDYDISDEEFIASENIVPKEEEAFRNLLEDVRTNSCGNWVYKSMDEEDEKDQCEPKVTKGFIELHQEKILELEEEKADLPLFSFNDDDTKYVTKKSRQIYMAFRKFIANPNITDEAKQNYTIAYSYVPMMVRDFVLNKLSFAEGERDASRLFLSILPKFPTYLFPEGDEVRTVLEKGTSKLGTGDDENFYKIIEIEDGESMLSFNSADLMLRDISTLARTPSRKNLIRAMKYMTLHTMASQVSVYNLMLGEDEKISIPNSCTDQRNGNLPSELTLKRKGNIIPGKEYVMGILDRVGFNYTSRDSTRSTFKEYFIDNGNRNPMVSAFSAKAPLDHYEKAYLATEGRNGEIQEMVFDDILNFDDVHPVLMKKAESAFYSSSFSFMGLNDSRTYIHNIVDLFKMINSKPGTEVFRAISENGDQIEIDTDFLNVSTYIFELMKKLKVDRLEDVVSKTLHEKFAGKVVELKMPSLYGSATWRSWALKELSTVIKLNKDNPIIRRQAQTYCGRRGTSACINQLISDLDQASYDVEYLPLRKLDETKLKSNYVKYERIWKSLQENTSLMDFTKVSELEYLLDQMKNGNHWARIKFSYEVAIDELENFIEGRSPNYPNNPVTYYWAQSGASRYDKTCFDGNASGLLSDLKKAGEKMGIDLSFDNEYSTKILSKKDFGIARFSSKKNKTQIWNSIIEKENSFSSSIFTVKDHEGIRAYKHMQNIAYETLINEDNVEKLMNSDVGNLISKEYIRDYLDEYLSGEDANVTKFFYNLYANKGNLEKQKELFTEFSKENAISSQYDLRQDFLIHDSHMKVPFFVGVVQYAAARRKAQVEREMARLCDLEPNNHENLMELFFSTSKAQIELNELIGADPAGNEVLIELEGIVKGMSPDEWKDMWLALGSAGLGIGVLLLGGACTIMSGGLCSPLAATAISSAMVAAGTYSIKWQAQLVGREYKRYKEGKESSDRIKNLEELGFATFGSHKGAKRSPFWTIFEAVSLFPLAGVVAKAGTVGPKLFMKSARAMLSKAGRASFKQTARRTIMEADTALSMYILGAGKWSRRSEKLKQVYEGYKLSSKKLFYLYRTGKISGKAFKSKLFRIMKRIRAFAKYSDDSLNMGNKVVLKESVESINKMTAKRISQQLGNNPKNFANLMDSYVKGGFYGKYSFGNRLDNARKTIENISTGKLRILQRIPILGSIYGWAKKIRAIELVKNAEKIKKLRTEARLLVQNGGDLEKFILNNIQDVSDVFIKIPLRKREFPYLVLLEGGYHFLIPVTKRAKHFTNAATLGLASWNNGPIIRQIVNARGVLVRESLKKSAREMLGLTTYVQAEATQQVFNAFNDTVRKAMLAMTDVEASNAEVSLDIAKKKIAERVLEAIPNIKGKKFKSVADPSIVYEGSPEDIYRFLFNPANDDEKAIGEVLWSSVKANILFELEELDGLAHQVALKLADYENVDDFEKLLSALKVLVLEKEKEAVQIM